MICDERHILETGLLKVSRVKYRSDLACFTALLSSQPCVCTRELCVFAFQTLGVMADAAEAIATDADVRGLKPFKVVTFQQLLFLTSLPHLHTTPSLPLCSHTSGCGFADSDGQCGWPEFKVQPHS